MSLAPLHVLFLCTGNSARSILAECLLNQRGEGRFVGHSAGSHPKGEVHPLAIGLLRDMNVPIEGLRSKSWDEFAGPDAPPIDFVITVCDNAAGETCPVWRGRPMTAHWGIADPAAVEGSPHERRAAFRKAFSELDSRIKIFTSLPIRALERARLQERVNAIGQAGSHDAVA
jgi:arsenate reductase